MRPVDFIFLLIIIACTAFYIWYKNRRPRTRSRQKSPNLNRAEKAALNALKEEGYTLHEIHPVIPVQYEVDKEKKKDFTHAGNFIVRKGGRSYLVKVVKGEKTALTSASARNDLLLDHLFFLPHGIIVYNVDNNRIQEVSFSFGGYSALEKNFTRVALIGLILAGIAFTAFYVYMEVFAS